MCTRFLKCVWPDKSNYTVGILITTLFLSKGFADVQRP